MNPSRSLLLLSCIVAGTFAGSAQQPGKANHHLSMQVDLVSSGGGQETTKGSGFGPGSPDPGSVRGAVTTSSSFMSASSSHTSAPRYKVQVSNFSAAPEDAVIEWYVFSKRVSTRGPTPEARVHDKGSEKMTVEGKKSAAAFFQPKPIISTTTQATSIRNQSLGGGVGVTSTATNKFTTGEKMTGWLVRLKVGSDLVAVKASSTALEEMGRKSAEIK